MLITSDDLPQRDRWARLRFAIIGPLLAAPPAAGELREALNILAAKVWRHPFTGLEIRFGCSTLERWYSAEQIVLRSQGRRRGAGSLMIKKMTSLARYPNSA
jgi:hypothetical protein